MNGRSLGDQKKLPRKKIATLFPSTGQIALVCDTTARAVACEAADERVPSYFVGGNSRFRTIIISSLSLSFSLTLPLFDDAGKRRKGGPLLSVTVRNYKGESAFKD